ncbi:MAG: SDR family oxidoreductase [Saprospiraceae bacterium]|nr:SDR family oxidoreductase [Saprospiraceae bacterium]
MMSKTVLITGCSSGFGKLAAKTFQAKGWNVIATMRSPQKETELTQLENIWVTRLDVTDQASIDATVQQGIEKYGAIDVLVNNAGYGGHAMLEQFTDEQTLAMFETNVFGLMRCCRAVLPHMRQRRNGSIINVTSMAGYLGLPLSSTYSASKYAVEGFTQALAHEYKPFNVKIRAIAPGAFGTNFSANTDNNFENGDDETRAFAQKVGAHFQALAQQMREQGGEVADPQEVADLIYTCATVNEMPVHNVVGADAKMLLGMKNSMNQQEFIDQMEAMLIPN